MSFDPEKNMMTPQAPAQEQQVKPEEGELREVESGEESLGESKEKEMDVASLKQALDNARDDYARVVQRRDSKLHKLRELLGNVDAGQDMDSDIMRSAYNSSLTQYREVQLAQIENMPDDQKKEALAQLKAFELQESCNLVDSHSRAKAETFGGKCAEMIQKTADWYKKIPTKYKIAASAVLFAGGLATGVGAAAGVLGVAAMGKRILGATAAGVGATGWLEARAQKKEQSHHSESLDNFKNLSMEEQLAQLKGFDEASFQKIDLVFQDKLSDRKKRVMVGLGAAAGIMALGDAGKIFSVGEAAAAEIPAPEQATVGAVESVPKGGNAALIQKAMEEMRAQQELAKNAAQGMGMNTENITATFQNESPIDINGQAVPQETTMAESIEKVQNATERPVKNDLLASLNKMKGSFGTTQEMPSATVQPAVENVGVSQEAIEVASPQTTEVPKAKEDIASRLNAMKKVFPSESIRTPESVVQGVENTHASVGATVEQSGSGGTAAVTEQAAPRVEKPHVAQMPSSITPEKMPIMSLAQEKAVIAEMIKDPKFTGAVSNEIQKLYGMSAQIAGGAKMGMLEGNNVVTKQQVERVVNLAKGILGDAVGTPGDNMTVGTYFTRIAAHAAHKKIPLGKIFS